MIRLATFLLLSALAQGTVLTWDAIPADAVSYWEVWQNHTIVALPTEPRITLDLSDGDRVDIVAVNANGRSEPLLVDFERQQSENLIDWRHVAVAQPSGLYFLRWKYITL